jgi:hypothetical protein
LHFGDTEVTAQSFNSIQYQCGFRAARAFDLAGPLFKFVAGATDDGQKEVQPGNKVVFAFMPALPRRSNVRHKLTKF